SRLRAPRCHTCPMAPRKSPSGGPSTSRSAASTTDSTSPATTRCSWSPSPCPPPRVLLLLVALLEAATARPSAAAGIDSVGPGSSAFRMWSRRIGIRRAHSREDLVAEGEKGGADEHAEDACRGHAAESAEKDDRHRRIHAAAEHQ